MSKRNLLSLYNLKTNQSLIQNEAENDKKDWKLYILPEVVEKYNNIMHAKQSRMRQTKQIRQESKQSDKMQNEVSDKERIQILTHENQNLKEQLKYLREMLLKILNQEPKS